MNTHLLVHSFNEYFIIYAYILFISKNLQVYTR